MAGWLILLCERGELARAAEHLHDRPRTRLTLSERPRTIPPTEPPRFQMLPVESHAEQRARARFESSIGRTARASHSSLTRRPEPAHRSSRRAPLCRHSELGHSSCCLRAAPRRPRWAMRRARARAPAPRGARVGGSRRCSSARTSRAVVVSSSPAFLVLSPVGVLVSRLLIARRSVRSEEAARAERQATCAQRTRRAYNAGGSHRRSRAGRSRAVVAYSSPSSLVLSVAPRAPLPRSTRAAEGGA